MQGKHNTKQSYAVEFFLTFFKADNPNRNRRIRVMTPRGGNSEKNLEEYFKDELQRNIAGINEFPIDDVGIEIVSIDEVPN